MSPIQITEPSLVPLPQPGTTTPALGLSLMVPPDSAANFAVIDSLFPAGTTSGASVVPVIQARLEGIHTTGAKTLSITASPSVNQLYAISLFEQATGTGAAGHTLVTTITYTSPAVVGLQTVTITMPLDSANIVMETYPFLVAAGASLTLTTAYGGGATNDKYTISARLVQ